MSVHIRRYYGSGPSEVDISGGANPIGLKLKTYDGDSTETYLFNATHPVPKPTIGNKHSFTATIALYSDVLGSEIYSDPKIYSGGVPSVPEPNPQGYVPWTGAQIFIADDTDDTYVRATGVTDDSGTEMVAQGLTSSKTDLLAHLQRCEYEKHWPGWWSEFYWPTVIRTKNIQIRAAPGHPGD